MRSSTRKPRTRGSSGSLASWGELRLRRLADVQVSSAEWGIRTTSPGLSAVSQTIPWASPGESAKYPELFCPLAPRGLARRRRGRTRRQKMRPSTRVRIRPKGEPGKAGPREAEPEEAGPENTTSAPGQAGCARAWERIEDHLLVGRFIRREPRSSSMLRNRRSFWLRSRIFVTA